MTPVPFVVEQHFEQVRSWLHHWGEQVTPDALPQTGFIIPGKATGFLYRTDSSMAYIENLVAAPGLDREERNAAIDAIVVAICEAATKLGFKLLVGTTVLDAVVKRAQRHGFVYVEGGFHVVAKKLG